MERRKLFLILVLLGASLACGLTPAADGGGLNDEHRVQTMVAQTLEANNLWEAATQAAVNATNQAAPTQPLPSEAATDTPQPTVEGAATATPTGTPTETATITPLPSATLEEGDPRQTLGEADFSDTFKNGTNWYLYSEEISKAEVKDGRFFYTMFKPQYGAEWTITVPRSRNYYVEVETEVISECSGKDNYGIIFRTPSDDTNLGYLYGFSCDGHFQLLSWDGKKFNTLLKFTSSDKIHKGKNSVNRLGIKVKGQNIMLYANGKQIATIEDTEHSGTRYGFFIWSQNTENFKVAFDNLYHWVLP
ncbi:MAG: DUF1080 domain-containing protein, partial [Anaerolineae bacterium]|nr:DUF1080 domain-containing protein [Anaerolineae bacterium]